MMNLLHRFSGKLSRLTALTLIMISGPVAAIACTSAIISADLNPYGRPILWKHRDTSTTDNKVEYVPARGGNHAYVALFNAKDKDLKQAWMGMNDVGFAIMNTASYNLQTTKAPKGQRNREGLVMAKALRECKSVDDFASLLDSLPRPMGVETNFGVIDAAGNGAYFETNNNSYTRYDLKDADNGVLVRTNYSYSGRKGAGSGYMREANAIHLLQPYVEEKAVTPEVLTEVVSRSFYRDKENKDFSCEPDTMLVEDDFIPRYKSTATVAIEGCVPVANLDSLAPGELADQYIMWTGIGYPPCAEILPVYCAPDGVDSRLRGIGRNGHSPLGDRIKAQRDDVFTIIKGDKKKYIDMTKLYNEEGTGYVQKVRPLNQATYDKARRKRDGK